MSICLTIWLPICQTDRHTGCPPIHPSAKGEHTALYAVIVFSLSLQFFIVVSSFLNSIRLFFLSRFYSFYSTLPVCMPIGCMRIHLPTVCTPLYVCLYACLSVSFPSVLCFFRFISSVVKLFHALICARVNIHVYMHACIQYTYNMCMHSLPFMYMYARRCKYVCIYICDCASAGTHRNEWPYALTLTKD